MLTRPLGASLADWLGFPRAAGGVGVGHGIVALITTACIVVVVAYLSWSKVDVARTSAPSLSRAGRALTESAPG